jgi:Carboxypeptidase regulatory-like domain
MVLGVFATGPAWAQAVAGSQLSGAVRDSSNAAIPGAEVTVTKTDTGMMRTLVTSVDGDYTFPNLPVGPYQLKVVLQGFNTYVQDGIVLQVGSNPVINVTLSVGNISEQVTVTANTALVETKNTGIGQVIDNQRVLEMPLNGRQATELIFLSGLATAAPAGDLNTNKNFPTVTISVAGGQANGMTYIMDGGTHNDPFNNLNLPTPFPDALQEFKVETSALPARYGHHAASAVNVVTKSGSNSMRGDLFEFWRNWRFNSKNYFSPTKDSLNRNQFGGTVGLPIVKDKVFFFGGYQGTDVKSNPATTVSYVPTQAMLNGDFTAFTSAACNGGRPVALRAPFVDNKIAPSQFSPVSLNFLKKVPVSTDPCGKATYGIPNNSTEHQGLGKVDYTLNGAQSVFVRYFYAVYDNPATYDGQNVLTLSRTSQNNQAHSGVAGHNFIISTNTLNSIHATFNRTLNDRSMPEYFSAADLGAKVYSPVDGYVGVSVTGNGFSVGTGATNPGYFNSKSYQLADDLDLIRGDHQLSFGINWIHSRIETLNNRPTNGAFTFNGQAAGAPLADFLIGTVSGGMIQGNPVYDYDHHDYVGVYAQDEWRVRSNLSFNFGLRWEPFNPVQNTFGWVSHFDQSRFDQNLRSTVYPQAPAGLIFPGDAGYPSGNGVTASKMNQFAPRLGMIWTPQGDQQTSVRASWGVFAESPQLFFNTRFANNPPWGAQVTISNPSFADPYANHPGGNPWPAAAKDWATLPFPSFGVYVNSPLDLQPTRLQQWNVSVQRQIGTWIAAASYLGNHSDHLWRATELNPAVYGPGASTTNTNQRRTLYLQNAAQGVYYGTIGQIDDTGRSNYNAILLSLQRPLRGNLSVLGNYTLSKCMADPATTEITGPTIMNPADPDLDYSYCSSDRRHLVNLSLVWRTPELSGSTMHAVISGWQLSPIVRYQSGNRSTVTLGVDNALTGMGNQRPVQILDDPYGDGTPANYINRVAFTSPAPGTYSTLKPFTILNPSVWQNDFALTRTFKAGGSNTLQFRWEVFNVINHVNFGSVPAGTTTAPIVTTLNSGSFGQIQTAGDPRIMQFALKFAY